MRISTRFMLFVQLLLVVCISSLPALADDTKKSAPKMPAAQTGLKNNAGSTSKGTARDSKGASKDSKSKGGGDTHKGTAGRE